MNKGEWHDHRLFKLTRKKMAGTCKNHSIILWDHHTSPCGFQALSRPGILLPQWGKHCQSPAFGAEWTVLTSRLPRDAKPSGPDSPTQTSAEPRCTQHTWSRSRRGRHSPEPSLLCRPTLLTSGLLGEPRASPVCPHQPTWKLHSTWNPGSQEAQFTPSSAGQTSPEPILWHRTASSDQQTTRGGQTQWPRSTHSNFYSSQI